MKIWLILIILVASLSKAANRFNVAIDSQFPFNYRYSCSDPLVPKRFPLFPYGILRSPLLNPQGRSTIKTYLSTLQLNMMRHFYSGQVKVNPDGILKTPRGRFDVHRPNHANAFKVTVYGPIYQKDG